MCNVELASRLVFIDTSAYETKNFQFGVHALGRLEELVDDKKIHLLISDVTIKEITSHLKQYSDDAARAMKKIQKEAMFLRNTEDLPCFNIFTKVNSDEVFQIVNAKFEALLEYPSVEIVEIKNVNPEVVFERYFNETPPFNNAGKKSEFPDAFVLEALNNLSHERHLPVYIVSGDGDMEAYANEHENLLYLNRVDEFIDLVVRNTAELEEPISFADYVFDQLKASLLNQAKEYLLGSEFYSDDADGLDDEIVEVIIDNIEVRSKSLLEVSKVDAEYEVDFEVTVTAEYIISAYERSPWDPEDKVYMFILYNQLIKQYVENYSANVIVGYPDGLKVNAEIIELSFESNFDLNTEKGEVVSFKEFDINGG